MKSVDFDLWYSNWGELKGKISRFCELKYKMSESEISTKCSSLQCVMNHALEDICNYFKSEEESVEKLCFLIRNIDVMISCIFDIYADLLGIKCGRHEPKFDFYKRCFDSEEYAYIIRDFRILRSMILAHPISTKFDFDITDKNIFLRNFISKFDGVNIKKTKGGQNVIYLEDILCTRSKIFGYGEGSYYLRLCYNCSYNTYSAPVHIDNDINLTIDTIIHIIKDLSVKIANIVEHEELKLRERKLCINNDSILSYINSLNDELYVRFPLAISIEKIKNYSIDDKLDNLKAFSDENDCYEVVEVHNSIINDCLLFFNVKFEDRTQDKYNIFLDYLKRQLKKIENDLQSMHYDENKDYFHYLDCYLDDLNYEHEKIQYLKDSDRFPFKEGIFDYSKASFAEECFHSIISNIEKYIPLDKSVNDKGLYCQYMAAVYLSNLEKRGNQQ